MTVKPIKNESDHKMALARIEELFDAEPGTPEGDELEVLITLVDYYEEKTFPELCSNGTSKAAHL